MYVSRVDITTSTLNEEEKNAMVQATKQHNKEFAFSRNLSCTKCFATWFV